MPKSRTSPANHRSKTAPSAFSPFARQKPNTSPVKARSKFNEEPLPDNGRNPSLAYRLPSTTTQTIPALIAHIRATTFSPVPDRGAGMSSTAIAEILRFRDSLPPLVTLGHLLTVCSSATAGEREVARLVGLGEVRRLNVVGRGAGGGEGVVLTVEWRRRVEEGLRSEESEDLRDAFLRLLEGWSGRETLDVGRLGEANIRTLVARGFLTNPHAIATKSADLYVKPRTGSVTGVGSVHESGSGMLANRDRPSISERKAMHNHMNPSLPSTGAYLSLLSSARAHLLHLLKSFSPKYRETTYEILRDKWDGNIPGSGAVSELKQARGQFTGVLPGKTKKWKEFYGMRFEWILEECVGAGLCEIFETGIGAWGIRGL